MATTTIAVAGATGKLGGRIIACLLERGANVRALVRPNAAADKVEALERPGVTIARVDMANVAELTKACAGASCVVSALQGLRDVIVGTQSLLLDAAIAAGVARFFPSDFAIDFMKLPAGGNRNFDLRRAFHERLAKAPIAATSILNGCFTEVLTYGTPLLDFKAKRVGYWDNADQRMDFTTMADTAAFTAAAALEPSTPKVLRVAGDQLTARELADVASEAKGTKLDLVRMGSLDELTAWIQHERAAHPESETQVFPKWQASQYIHDMFDGRAKLEPLDNARYPDLAWTKVRDVIARLP